MRLGPVFLAALATALNTHHLRGDDRYRPLFRDHRVAGGWLPKTMYVTRFEDSSFRSLADFEEDINVTTGSAPGVALRGTDFGTWREGRLDLRPALELHMGGLDEEPASRERPDPARLREIALVFDRTGAGTVVVDDVGLARLHPGFTAARVPRG